MSARNAQDRIIVTLDGPAGVGKSSMARELSEALGIPYLDTGAMFRGVAWKLGENAWEWDEAWLSQALDTISFELHGSGADSGLSLDNVPLGEEIRNERVGMWASNLAKLPVIREFLKKAQRDIGERSSLVAEGRDMGSVVFPQATVKFFLDADVRERARRRYEQLREKNEPADMEELAESIRARDDQDRNRAVAPLRPAEDAVLVDTTHLNREQVAALLIGTVRERING
ncbi:MAG: (d)CMP kinase [Desulfovibrio sp.]